MNILRHTGKLASCLILSGLLFSCGGSSTPPAEGTATTTQPPAQPTVQVPDFNADSAYAFTKKQVDFGFRIPNTKAHDACAAWLVNKLKQYTKEVEVQEGEEMAYNGSKLKIKNIFAYFNKNAKRRIIISAHYDSRPWDDMDSGVESGEVPPQPILAACDAGSGVAVILELARQFSMKAPNVGIILFLNDAEDYGTPNFAKSANNALKEEDSYCLGTQMWARKLDKNKYYAEYGILLDMVGAKGARFLQERMSTGYAGNIVNKVWSKAQELGYRDNFIVNETARIIDDHQYFNQVASIPTIDIVDYDANRPAGFAWYWHTLKDNMDIIDKNVLKAVGQTLTDVLYHEQLPPQ